MNRTNIEFVNHASVLISHGEINILSDPWYSGAVFHQGWRLLYENTCDKINDILKKLHKIVFLFLFKLRKVLSKLV